MTATEQFLHDYVQAEPEKREAMLRAFLLKPVEPKVETKDIHPIPAWDHFVCSPLGMILLREHPEMATQFHSVFFASFNYNNWPAHEPKSGIEVCVWQEGESVWGYLGTLSVVIQFAKPSPEMASMPHAARVPASNTTEPMIVSRCPACERRIWMNEYPGRKVKRWLVLPP